MSDTTKWLHRQVRNSKGELRLDGCLAMMFTYDEKALSVAKGCYGCGELDYCINRKRVIRRWAK